MQYVNLGATGLRVSRVCLGMMSYGKHESRPWTLDEEAAEPIVRTAVEGGINFYDTADVYNGGESEVLTGRLLRRLFGMREEYVARDQGQRPYDARRERAGAVAQAHHGVDRRLAAAAGAGLRRPVPDPSVRSEHSGGGDDGRPARRRHGGQGALPRGQFDVRLAVREAAVGRADAVRVDAEPLQPDLSRGGAGDDPAVHRSGGRRDPVEPAGPGDADRQPDPRRRQADDSCPDRLVRRQPVQARARLRRDRASRSRSRRPAGCRPHRWRWRGCCTGRV